MKYRILSVVVCLAVLLGLSGCAKESEYPQGYEQFKAVVGDTREESLRKLKMEVADLTDEDQYTYLLPGTYEFCGYAFEVRLVYDSLLDRLTKIKYSILVDDISGVPALKEKMIGLYGTPGNDSFQEEYVNRLAEKKKGTVTMAWSMYRFTEEHHPEFVRCLKKYAENGSKQMDYFWNAALGCNYSEDLEKYNILMMFYLGPDNTTSWQPGQPRG